MKTFATFVLSLLSEIEELWMYSQSGREDPEEERQIAMRLIRKAKDEQARREIGGV